MKKIIVSVVTASILIATGCKSAGGGDPKAVLMSFVDALSKKDFTAAKNYVTKDSEGMLGMMQMGVDNMKDTSQSRMFNKENMELGEAVISGDKATIPVTDKKSGETTDFTLKKENGDWKVAFDKSTLMEMAQKKMKEHGMGKMQNDMTDSSGNINNRAMPNMDSVSQEDIQKAQKLMDSAGKMLNDAKNNAK